MKPVAPVTDTVIRFTYNNLQNVNKISKETKSFYVTTSSTK